MTGLDSWNDRHARKTIEGFVARVTNPRSTDFVPVEARVAVFDSDGTLWCEQPMPVELAFIVERLDALALDDAPRGGDGDAATLARGVMKAFEGMRVDTYHAAATAFLRHARHPTLNRLYRECSYLPMVELLQYLESHGFTNYIASGGDRDFMRVITLQIYGVPPERVVGSTNALCYTEDDRGGAVSYLTTPDVFDDGAAKPARIWRRVGRRPIVACGNSNDDIRMLEYAGGTGRPSLRILVQHDDPNREFEYEAGAERALDLARSKRWTIVSMQRDWSRVFSGLNEPPATRDDAHRDNQPVRFEP